MRFSYKHVLGLSVGVLTLEPPTEATVGTSEWFIAPASSKSCSSRSLACLAVPQHCLFGSWCFPAGQQQLGAMGTVG